MMTRVITDSIEKSLQNCSLTHGQGESRTVVAEGTSSTSDDSTKSHLDFPSNTSQFNSAEFRLPCYWEQCLDLKTGEIMYYINRRTGMKTQEDPRRTNPEMHAMNLICSEEEEKEEEGGDDDEDNDSCSYYESEGSSSSSSPKVLVVAGCKRCFMYFMVPKLLPHCPKCFALLLHFHPS